MLIPQILIRNIRIFFNRSLKRKKLSIIHFIFCSISGKVNSRESKETLQQGKNDFKKAQRSRTSRDAVDKAENEIKRFRFLGWLNRFLQAQETKSSITIVEQEDIDKPQNNCQMDKEFLEDQIEENEKAAKRNIFQSIK